jgi:hypothetical protein
MSAPVDWDEIADLVTILRGMELGAFPSIRAAAHATLLEIETELEAQKARKGEKHVERSK